MSRQDRAPSVPRWQVASYWAGVRGCPFVPFIDEPSCFACGYGPFISEGVVSRAARWNKARLETAHLVPHALGGAQSPRNLVLLCRRCHEEAPDYADERYMLRWCRDREDYVTWRLRTIAEALAQTPLPPEELLPFVTGRREEFWQFARERLVLHGGHMSVATLLAALEDYARQQ